MMVHCEKRRKLVLVGDELIRLTNLAVDDGSSGCEELGIFVFCVFRVVL